MMAARPSIDALLEVTVRQPQIALFRELAQQDPVRDADQLWASIHGITSMLIAKPLLAWEDPTRFVERAIDALCGPQLTAARTTGDRLV